MSKSSNKQKLVLIVFLSKKLKEKSNKKPGAEWILNKNIPDAR